MIETAAPKPARKRPDLTYRAKLGTIARMRAEAEALPDSPARAVHEAAIRQLEREAAEYLDRELGGRAPVWRRPIKPRRSRAEALSKWHDDREDQEAKALELTGEPQRALAKLTRVGGCQEFCVRA
jgi:hypothetical protein